MIAIVLFKTPHICDKSNMKNINKLEDAEKKFCKLTRGFTHEDCPDDCPHKVIKKIPENNVPTEYKLRTDRDNLYIYWVMERAFKLEDEKYEIKRAMEECKFIKLAGYIKDKTLRKLLTRVGNSLAKNAVKVIDPEPKSEIEAYRIYKEFYGDISHETHNTLCSKIRDLMIIEGKKWNKEISRVLQKASHLSGEDKKIIKYWWDWIRSEEYEKMSRNEIDLLREIKKIRGPLKGVRNEERKKPFKFNKYDLSSALKKEIIDTREYMILECRFNLDGKGIRSLRLIAGWLKVSHTTVRNIEIKALKKMQDYYTKQFSPLRDKPEIEALSFSGLMKYLS